MNPRRSRTLDRLRYWLVIVGLSPALLVYTLWTAWRHRSMRYLRQRLGLFSRQPSVSYWLHAASVGEVNAIAPLVRLLRQRYPQRSLLITTNTPTGADTVERQFDGEVTHAYLPLDWPMAVQRFLCAFRPRCALIVETELWPNLYRLCERRKIPIVIVNGRLSSRTLKTGRWLRRLYGDAVSGCRAILARSDSDCANFMKLGAAPEQCQVIGNIKFSALTTPDEVAPFDAKRPYLLAASTREDEEKQIVDAWRELPSPRPLLIIAPRHPQRLGAITQVLDGRQIRYAVRSREESLSDTCEVYVADTLGELVPFLLGAELVFMGGSLVPKGGQNLLEPALLGKAVIVGPHMDNFADETRLLRDEGAIIQVADKQELTSAMQALLNDPQRRRELGEQARNLVNSQRDMAERYFEQIDALCLERFES